MSFVTLHTGLSGIRAAQTGVDITSNNIANVNTRGYTRQRVEQQQRFPYDSLVGQVGLGVEVDQVVRLRDSFLDARVRTTTATFARSDTRAQLLERLEGLLSEPDAGVSTELGELWASFEDLALQPDSGATRGAALAQLEQVAARVRDVAVGQQQLRDDTTATRDDIVTEARDLLQAVVDINVRVRDAPRDEPNLDLLDQRDLHVDRLAELLGVQSSPLPDGSITVTLGGTDLVAGDVAATLDVDAASGLLTVDGTSVPLADTGAELGGVLAVLVEDLPGFTAELDAFVGDLVTALNDQHAAGFTDAGTAGGALLGHTAGDPGSLAVLLTDPGDLAVHGSATAAGFDGENAAALAGLRTDGHDAALRRVLVGLGTSIAAANRSADAAADVATSAEVARQSQHGVSLDEEMVALVQYQRSLEAAGRVMTAADEMLDTIINRTGVVGR